MLRKEKTTLRTGVTITYREDGNVYSIETPYDNKKPSTHSLSGVEL